MNKKIDMTEALDMLGFSYPHGKSNFNIICPFCGDSHKNKRKTMNINMNKGVGGVYSCLRCNKQGHVITFWREVRGLSSNKEAAAEIRKGLSEYKPVKKVARKIIKENPIAPIETRHKTYSALIDNLVLTDYHRKSLRDRGLSNAYIDKKKYKSYPQTSHEEIATVLLDQGYILDGVPGFYKEKGVWKLRRYSSGILIPQKDGFGRIQGFQIRMDNSKGGKYLNLSSLDLPNGTGAKTFAHLSYSRDKDLKELILTEGALKADVISYLSQKSVLAVPGVNSIKYLPGALHDLKKKGLKKVCIAFDMDLYDNPNVYRALCKLKNLIREADIPFCTYNWNSDYKGLDDYLKNAHT